MYRIYNTEKKKWIRNDIYLSPDPYSDLYILKKSMFGREKLVPISDDNYVIHRDIELYDKNENLVYEGDYVKAKVAENKTAIGLVTYAAELSSYIILCMSTEEYYTLGSEICEYIEVVGNVFDGYDEEEQDGQQSLQESEEQS
jgi:hypothetical protein